MSVPNLDLTLIDLFKAAVEEVQDSDSQWVIDDLFADRSDDYLNGIKLYLSSVKVTSDMREREDGQRFLYVIPSFPMADMPFPQIGVYLAPEEVNDFFLGNSVGIETTEIKDASGTTIALEKTNGCFGQAAYWADIVANTKEEVIWLSRICQRSILVNLKGLEELGAMEIRISLGDLKLEQEHYPAMVFARRLIFNCKLGITWTERIPLSGTYATGINKALAGLETP